MQEPILSVHNLTVRFGTGRKAFEAVSGVSFDLFEGETLSLVGESGSGKTTIGRAIMRVHPVSTGSIRYRGQEIAAAVGTKDEKLLRQKIQMIFQDPMASLNERAKIDYIVSEGLYNFRLFASEKERRARVENALLEVGLLPEFASRFPHEFSGGQRQRIGIARALVMEPEIIIADEPISALDVSIRAQVINVLNRLKRDKSLSYLFIAHDLSVVRFISDRIAVIHRGHLVELAQAEELFSRPLHPYTRALLSAIPVPDPDAEHNRSLIVYDPSMHRYDSDPPAWSEAYPGHYVLANPAELTTWVANATPEPALSP
ncbi:MAG: ATP-binding cassette domain-containing protein [Spirochaetales bacterium]|nr:ATP-binding cassette domain-containing protein [Spirochaetales bacterium]